MINKAMNYDGAYLNIKINKRHSVLLKAVIWGWNCKVGLYLKACYNYHYFVSLSVTDKLHNWQKFLTWFPPFQTYHITHRQAPMFLVSCFHIVACTECRGVIFQHLCTVLLEKHCGLLPTFLNGSGGWGDRGSPRSCKDVQECWHQNKSCGIQFSHSVLTSGLQHSYVVKHCNE
jgi:hypothetical protein